MQIKRSSERKHDNEEQDSRSKDPKQTEIWEFTHTKPWDVIEDIKLLPKI